MKTIRELNAPPHIAGRVEAIIVRGSPREPARRIAATTAVAGIGLADDRLGQRGEAELSTRQVTLTGDGQELYARCRRIVDEIEGIRAEADGVRGQPSGPGDHGGQSRLLAWLSADRFIAFLPWRMPRRTRQPL